MVAPASASRLLGALRLDMTLKTCGLLRQPYTHRLIYSLASRGFGLDPESRAEYESRRPPPFPYKKYAFNSLWAALDGTLKRWDDNTKVVVIEGPPASGKSTFARALSEVTGMKLFSAVTADMVYVNSYGFDQRHVARYLPGGGRNYRDVRCLDWPDFYAEPTDRAANAKLLHTFAFLRLVQYIDVLEHLYHTGQGCIIDQSYFGDYIYGEAFTKLGFLSREARNVLVQKRYICIGEDEYLNYPHLVIYLDVAPEVCLDRIKKRGVPSEVQSPLFQNTDYLKAVEWAYKDQFFIDLERFSEIVVYDWNKFGDMEWVCDDLEKLDLEFHNEDIHRLRDWYYHNDNTLGRRRIELAKRSIFYNTYHPYSFACDDFNIDPNQMLAYKRVLEECPGEQYEGGFNANMGDRHLLFKQNSTPFRYINDRLPLILEKKAAMDRIINDPANQRAIHERSKKIVELDMFKDVIDHY